MGEGRLMSVSVTQVVLRKPIRRDPTCLLSSSLSAAQSEQPGFCSKSHRFLCEWGVPWAPFSWDFKLSLTSLIFPLAGSIVLLNPKPLPVSKVPSELRCCCPPNDKGQRLFLPEPLPALQPAVTSPEGPALLPLSPVPVAEPSRSRQEARGCLLR